MAANPSNTAEAAAGPQRQYWITPIRLNLLIIALFIAALNAGIMVLCGIAIASLSSENGNASTFVLGALIGLLPTGITGLVGLGTTLLNDSQSGY